MRLAMLVLAVASAATGALAAGCSDARQDPLPGVQLGMAPRDVRERFQPGGEGRWDTQLGASADDTALNWHATDPASTAVPEAHFEFHLGMLVAVRGHINAEVPPGTNVTPKTVTSRTRGAARAGRPGDPAGTDVTSLARDCPTHHDEAEALVARVSSR